MALNSLHRAEVPLGNCSFTHSLTMHAKSCCHCWASFCR